MARSVTAFAAVLLLLFLLPAGSLRAEITYSDRHVFENVPPAILAWACPVPQPGGFWPAVTSKWNQPRGVGTNPHQGIDVGVDEGTEVYAVWDGWLTHYGDGVILQLDVNPTYYVRYYHMAERGDPKRYKRGEPIGTSGTTEYGAHLHFGGTTDASTSPKWYRNEVNYRWNGGWNKGRDVDSYSNVEWNDSRLAKITAYFLDENGLHIPAEVRIFHRPAGTSTWTNGGLMTHQGNHDYVYDFAGRYASGTAIDWLVRIQRSNLTVYSWCWAPSQYERPREDPNSVTLAYPHYRNTLIWEEPSDDPPDDGGGDGGGGGGGDGGGGGGGGGGGMWPDPGIYPYGNPNPGG
ncbi:MAG: M23 family metallopeptidase [bacterium]|nr:M23 family metallopeptidase [bacterium]